MSSKDNDYQGCLRALARAIAQAVGKVQSVCMPVTVKPSYSSSPEATAQTPLIDTLREFYAQHLKAFFDAKKGDEAIERETGVAYGALITHLQAIAASWQVFSGSNNKHIDLNVQSQVISEQALRAGEDCYEAAVEALGRLMKEEAAARIKAETFIEMMWQHIQRTEHRYYSDPHYRSAMSGYYVHHVYLAEQTRKFVRFEFMYWDNVDMIMVPFGALFMTEPEQATFREIAKKVYGPSVRIRSDFSHIEVDETK